MTRALVQLGIIKTLPKTWLTPGMWSVNGQAYGSEEHGRRDRREEVVHVVGNSKDQTNSIASDTADKA